MFTKRTLVLSSVEGNMEKAVANFEKCEGGISGTVKLYNFRSEPNGVLTLGFLSGGEVYKAGLTKNGFNEYGFKLYINADVTDFTCALVNSFGGEIRPLLIGSSQGASSMSAEERLASSLGVLQKKSMDGVKKVLDENGIDTEEDIEAVVDEAMKNCDENCVLCPYKKAFFEGDAEPCCQAVSETKPEIRAQEEIHEVPEMHEEEKPEPSQNFYNEIEEQLNSLFKKYEESAELESIIPNSKWVKVDYDEKGTFYVVGLIYENEEVKYICYGTPGVWAEKCPAELDGLAEWLPLDENNPHGDGYWITYQDAGSGENVKIEVI